MSKIEELYAKVATDSTLQRKFAEIMSEAEATGKAKAEEALVAFAKEAGYEIPFEEARQFMENLVAKKKNGELTDTELDLVAGGKSDKGVMAIFASVISAGIGCGILSIVGAFENAAQGCLDQLS